MAKSNQTNTNDDTAYLTPDEYENEEYVPEPPVEETQDEVAETTERPTDVKFGESDSEGVRLVQRALGRDETGDYDHELIDAVRTWQNANGFVGGQGVWLNSVQLEKLLG